MALIHQYVRSAPMSRIPRRLPPQPQENGVHARTSSAPSKLEKLQADFQRRMLQEKSEKMVSLYEQNKNRALAKVQKDLSNRNGSVREFFKQRRTNNYLDQNGWNNASQASSGQSTPTGYAAKPPIYKQRDHSGRDRSKPLAPIEPRTPPDHSRTYKVTNGVPMHSPKPPLPRNEKQSYVRPQIKGVIKNNTNDHSPSGQRGKPNQRKHFRSESEGSAGKVQGWQKWQEQQRLAREKKTRRKQSITDNEESDDGSSQKLSDFQKWQLQQNKEREARLKNHKTNNRNYQDENENYIMDSNRSNKSNKKPPPVDKRIFLQMRNRQGSFEQFSDGDNEEDDDDESSPPSRPLSQREQVLEADIIARKEAEMMAMLDKKRRELESIQAVTKEEEKREAERKKREKAQEQRMRKIREAEEAQKRLQEEEEEREEAERRKREEEEEEERRRVEEKKRKLKLKAKTPIKQRVKPRESPPQEDEYKIDNTQSVAFYANIVDEEGGNVQLQLKPCSVCGRKFAAERLQKHMKACSQSSKKTRKVFDPMKMRVKGTDHEQFAVHAVKNPTPEKKKTSAWRKKHEEFQNAIKYAKKVTAVEAAGGNVAALPPPPRSENADYKQCPYCQRKFNEGAAERHIPWCKEKSQKSRPSPTKKNTRNKYR